MTDYERKGLWITSPLHADEVHVDQFVADALSRMAELEAVVDRLADDGLAERVGCDCHDECHDGRYCSACEHRLDGIDDYRQAVQKAGK